MSDQHLWQNWAGHQQHNPSLLAQPAGTEDIQQLLASATIDGQQVRCVGSAHSFVPYWCDDVIVSLDALSGLVRIDVDKQQATVGAGSKIHELGPMLWSHGLSLGQQGDIDRQSIAGAIGTGTHGTGRDLKNLSAAVVSAKLVTASGESLSVNEQSNPELLRALRVSQGMLGILTEITLQLEAAFNLHERIWMATLAECRAELATLIAENRHFEFFWTPNTDRFEMKTLNKTQRDVQKISEQEYIAPAYQAFPSQREARFNEMEYSVPEDQGWSCFCELREALLERFPKLPWPIEYRTLAADDAMLSTASGRDCVTLSVHQGAERDYHELFDLTEAIFKNHAGRPHWGKLHSLTASELEILYPEYATFCAIRESIDPQARFCNDYLSGLFRAE